MKNLAIQVLNFSSFRFVALLFGFFLTLVHNVCTDRSYIIYAFDVFVLLLI